MSEFPAGQASFLASRPQGHIPYPFTTHHSPRAWAAASSPHSPGGTSDHQSHRPLMHRLEEGFLEAQAPPTLIRGRDR